MREFSLEFDVPRCAEHILAVWHMVVNDILLQAICEGVERKAELAIIQAIRGNDQQTQFPDKREGKRDFPEWRSATDKENARLWRAGPDTEKSHYMFEMHKC